MKKTRRNFIKRTGVAAGAGMLWLYGCGPGSPEANGEQNVEQASDESRPLFFDISLAQWSLHRTIRDKKELDNLDFAPMARSKFGIGAVEYVNQFFKDKAGDMKYLGEMKKRAEGSDVRSLLIMVDGEGGMAETDDKKRKQAIENHYKWVDAARFLGCHSIRVNAYSSDTDPDAAALAAIDGLGKLAEYGQSAGGINVIVENHGGFSSDGEWLSHVMEQVGMENCGTLPDFGNFCIRRGTGSEWSGKCVEEYDRYEGVEELMPYAKGVSAKSHEFDENGNEIHTDYVKMLQIVKDAGYRGHIGIEYEGDKLSEEQGIMMTKALLEKAGDKVS